MASPDRYTWVRPLAIVIGSVALVAAIGLLVTFLASPSGIDDFHNLRGVGAFIFASVMGLLALSVLVFRPETGELRSLVKTSVSWTVALLIGLVATWWIVVIYDPLSGWFGELVVNDQEVEQYFARNVPEGADPLLIPTGVHVKSLEFLTGDNVQLTGYYWQRLGPEVPDDFVAGLVLPESIRDAYKQTEAYRYTEGDVETIGWYFETTIREPFDYTYFPFDRQDVWMRIWSRDFTRDVVLVPDFSSYANMDPRAYPGLEGEFVYSGWVPRFSGFSLAQQTYTTSFGVGDSSQISKLPELYFNLILDRKFVGPFFEHFIFALAVAVVLYGLLVLTTDDESLKSRFQLTTAGVLAACSGLIFAVILKHNQLRSLLATRGVSYIEIIPILLYLAIGAVIVNAILLASPVTVPVIHYRNNLLPVLLFWPVLLGLVFLSTLYLFFIA